MAAISSLQIGGVTYDIYAKSAEQAPGSSHELSSHSHFSTYFNGTSANSALTSKSALSAGSAAKAASATSALTAGLAQTVTMSEWTANSARPITFSHPSANADSLGYDSVFTFNPNSHILNVPYINSTTISSNLSGNASYARHLKSYSITSPNGSAHYYKLGTITFGSKATPTTFIFGSKDSSDTNGQGLLVIRHDYYQGTGNKDRVYLLTEQGLGLEFKTSHTTYNTEVYVKVGGWGSIYYSVLNSYNTYTTENIEIDQSIYDAATVTVPVYRYSLTNHNHYLSALNGIATYFSGTSALSALTAKYAVSAGAAPVGSHTISSHSDSANFFSGNSAKSACSATSAKNAGTASYALTVPDSAVTGKTIGTATNAKQVSSTHTGNNGNYYLEFIDSSANGYKKLYHNTGLLYNPSAHILYNSGSSATIVNGESNTITVDKQRFNFINGITNTVSTATNTRITSGVGVFGSNNTAMGLKNGAIIGTNINVSGNNDAGYNICNALFLGDNNAITNLSQYENAKLIISQGKTWDGTLHGTDVFAIKGGGSVWSNVLKRDTDDLFDCNGHDDSIYNYAPMHKMPIASPTETQTYHYNINYGVNNNYLVISHDGFLVPTDITIGKTTDTVLGKDAAARMVLINLVAGKDTQGTITVGENSTGYLNVGDNFGEVRIGNAYSNSFGAVIIGNTGNNNSTLNVYGTETVSSLTASTAFIPNLTAVNLYANNISGNLSGLAYSAFKIADYWTNYSATALTSTATTSTLQKELREGVTVEYFVPTASWSTDMTACINVANLPDTNQDFRPVYEFHYMSPSAWPTTNPKSCKIVLTGFSKACTAVFAYTSATNTTTKKVVQSASIPANSNLAIFLGYSGSPTTTALRITCNRIMQLFYNCDNNRLFIHCYD